MPPRLPAGQPDGPAIDLGTWFQSAAGQAILQSESASIRRVLDERPGRFWLWLAPAAGPVAGAAGHGLRLAGSDRGWAGSMRCALPLPMANASVAVVVVQHTGRPGKAGAGLIEECARVLLPGGSLWLYALNPLSPYRWRWKSSGLRASEPTSWRSRLRAAGLQPDGMAQGVGPLWRVLPQRDLQPGPGLRAAFLLHAEKRSIPLTPVRQRAPLRLGKRVPAA